MPRYKESKEEEVLRYVLNTPGTNNPENLIKTIDKFCWWDNNWMMNVGDVKGLILDNEVKRKQPLNALELGAYCGYSATRIARLLPEGGHLYSIEPNMKHVAYTTTILDHCGLKNKVTILYDTLSKKIKEIKEIYKVPYFDLVFLDHIKDMYLPDFILLEENGLITEGSVIVSDNALYPGCPDFLEFLTRNQDKYQSIAYNVMLEYDNEIKDQIWVTMKR